MKILAGEPRLHGFAGKLGGNRFEDAEHAGDRHQLGVKLLAEYPRGQLAARPGQRASAERAIDMEAAVRHDLRPGTDPGGDDEIAISRVDTLPGTHGLMLNQGGEARIRQLRRRGRCCWWCSWCCWWCSWCCCWRSRGGLSDRYRGARCPEARKN